MWPVSSLVIGVLLLLPFGRTATHDELPQCSLAGVYKTRQVILESPNYPDNYPPNTCYDYIIRSPYRCPTKFHIQFLDFHLESSRNCANDYLAIGLEHDGDDMDLLCGQVIGIKKYHTPDGVLRLRFFADDSSRTTAKGFKLLITRLACERDELRKVDDSNESDTVSVNAPPDNLPPELARNVSSPWEERMHPLPQLYNWNLPSLGYYPLGAQIPNAPAEGPCIPTANGNPLVPPPNALSSASASRSQYAGIWPSRMVPGAVASSYSQLEGCCISSFKQKRFYLSSPGFPRTVFSSLLRRQQRDCVFKLEKSSQKVCRLRIELKFFDFGQSYSGTGSIAGNIGAAAIASSKDICTEDYIELDGERFCGCRSGYVFNALWGEGEKYLRMRIGYSGVPSRGFLLEITQDECSETQLLQTLSAGLNNNVNRVVGVPHAPDAYLQSLAFMGQQPQQQAPLQTGLAQQQLAIYQSHLLPQPIPQIPLNIHPAQQFWMSPTPNPYLGLPQMRYARSYTSIEYQQKPVTIVETNSTRKEYYFADGDDVGNGDGNDYTARSRNDENNVFTSISRSDDDAALVRLDEEEERANSKYNSTEDRRCKFDMADLLRLSVDVLWLTKPTCYAPRKNWFNNILG